jgi:hypothetical protein
MHEELQPLEGQRLTVRGVVAKRGVHVGWANITQPTIMLAPIATLDGRELTDHIWFKVGARLAALAPHIGDTLELSVRVRPYRKCFIRCPGKPAAYRTDLGLAYPTQIRKTASALERSPHHAS